MEDADRTLGTCQLDSLFNEYGRFFIVYRSNRYSVVFMALDMANSIFIALYFILFLHIESRYRMVCGIFRCFVRSIRFSSLRYAEQTNLHVVYTSGIYIAKNYSGTVVIC